MPARPNFSWATSRTTGLPTKKPGERSIQASSSASHSKIGGSGERTNAR
jgi:hypothetical protein